MYSALSKQISIKSWVIDSGASRHITGYKEVLDSTLEEVNDKVTIGDNFTHPIKGIGNCTLKLKLDIFLHL